MVRPNGGNSPRTFSFFYFFKVDNERYYHMVVVVLLLRRGPKKTKKKGNRAIKPHSPPHSTIKPLIGQFLHILNIEGRIWCSSIHAIVHIHTERLHSSNHPIEVISKTDWFFFTFLAIHYAFHRWSVFHWFFTFHSSSSPSISIPSILSISLNFFSSTIIQSPQYNLRNSKHLDGNSNYW